MQSSFSACGSVNVLIGTSLHYLHVTSLLKCLRCATQLKQPLIPEKRCDTFCRNSLKSWFTRLSHSVLVLAVVNLTQADWHYVCIPLHRQGVTWHLVSATLPTTDTMDAPDSMDGTFMCAACECERCMNDLVWLGSCDCNLCRSCLSLHAARYWRYMAEQLQVQKPADADSEFLQLDCMCTVTQLGKARCTLQMLLFRRATLSGG